MDQDKYALVEKILMDVDNVMSRNAELYTFDIVPVEVNNKNKSPVLHYENCLGLESWCVKHVYMYCYSEIMNKFMTKPKRKSIKLSYVDTERLIRLLNMTLLLNPGVCTFWNKRKDLLLNNLLDTSLELRFTRLVLSWKPKCNDIFSHRRWIFDSIVKEEHFEIDDLNNLVNEELSICELSSEKCPNNYHSWNHRMWLLNTLQNMDKIFDINLLYIREFKFSLQWNSKHVSDHSCFHYRQFCIRNIMKVAKNLCRKTFNEFLNVNLHDSLTSLLTSELPNWQKDLSSSTDDNIVNLLFSSSSRSCGCDIDNYLICRKLEVLFYELTMNNELICYYKGHETLWYHRRFIVCELISIVYDYFGFIKQNGVLNKAICRKCSSNSLIEKQAKIVRYDSDHIYSSNLIKIIFNHEEKFIKQMLTEGDNYSIRHEKYLKYIKSKN